ncbi:DUF6907 domain-containing protein [Streptomyces sp. NPDC000880]
MNSIPQATGTAQMTASTEDSAQKIAALRDIIGIAVAEAELVSHTAPTACGTYIWCAETGEHETHNSAYAEVATPDGYGDSVLPANIMECGGKPFIGFLDLDLTPAQTRERCAEIRDHLDKVVALADQLDGKAPLDPAAEKYSVTAAGANGALINAEIYQSDDPDRPHSKITVYPQAACDSDLDVAGADKLIADLEQFIPRLRAMRNHLATVEANK